jgi:polysaccharide export outer membrane protein
VTVVVKERYGSTVSILGQVTEPGSYDSLGSRRLMDFLALAGGLTDDAGRQVQVRRFSPGRSTPKTFLIDLDRLVHQGHPQLNISIQGGDAIYVPRAGLVYVDGAVRSPGNYPIEAGMTVQEAIVAAGGFAVSAQTDSVTLIRMMDSGHREVVELSSGRGQSAEPRTLEVQERDVIFVPRSAVRDALYSVRLHFLGSLVGFGFEPPPR